MRPRTLALTALALAALAPFSARPALAWSYGDTLTTIWRPLPNLPALVRPGDTLTVWANAPSSAGNWAATLHFGALHVPLVPAGGGWQATKGRFELGFTVPPATPEEIYGLSLVSDATPSDTAWHSVKVLPAYRSDYVFAQISDTHLPEHAFSTAAGVINAADTSGMGDFDTVIEDLNVIHPEFIIHTGDLVNEGELEEYLGMYEMGRAQAMLGHLDAPVWVSSGNHDIGGWKPTLPPDGFSRMNWWRHFGWRFLGNPPPGDPYHSQDFTFDYGPLHAIGLEAYINTPSYDTYRQDIWGAQSFTPEQLAWLQSDIAAQPAGTHSLLFYHYDFGGTLADGVTPGVQFSQINPDLLGIDGDIWGHNHTVADNMNRPRTAHPFDLGSRSVIDYRAFRIFRVHDGVMTPGPQHFATGLSAPRTDSMSVTWSGPNNGTRAALTLTVVNRFGESWDHARVRFVLPDHDSTFTSTGGTIAQVIRQGGVADVTVDAVIPASATQVIAVAASQPVTTGVPGPGREAFALGPFGPNPFRPESDGAMQIHYALAEGGQARLDIVDVSGRRVARLADGPQSAGRHDARWNGRDASGRPASPGLYFVRLADGRRVLSARLALTR